MATPREEALETLTSLKTDFDAAVKDAQDDQKQWRWLRRYVDPKAREEEFAGYVAQTASAADAIGKDDKASATAALQGMKTAFDAVAAGCRAQKIDILESFFGLNTQEAMKFECWSASVDKVMKLI
jgi:hypothetical protein